MASETPVPLRISVALLPVMLAMAGSSVSPAPARQPDYSTIAAGRRQGLQMVYERRTRIVPGNSDPRLCDGSDSARPADVIRLTMQVRRDAAPVDRRWPAIAPNGHGQPRYRRYIA